MKTNRKYIPSVLSKSDKEKQTRNIRLAKTAYKRGEYVNRPKLASFKSKPSRHIQTAKRVYGVNAIGATRELANKTGCSMNTLRRIIRKGKGAYYSSGSRPNQTPSSWGVARLASALTSGKSALVDSHLLLKGCKKGSKGYMSVQTAKRRYK